MRRAEVWYFAGALCPVCRRMTPVVRSAADRFDDVVTLVEIDVAADKVKALEQGVRAVPTLLAVHDGSVVGRVVGAQSVEAVDAVFAGAAAGDVGPTPLTWFERRLRLGAAIGLGTISPLTGEPLLFIPALGLAIWAFRDKLRLGGR